MYIIKFCEHTTGLTNNLPTNGSIKTIKAVHNVLMGKSALRGNLFDEILLQDFDAIWQ